jgi:hypothetical protein
MKTFLIAALLLITACSNSSSGTKTSVATHKETDTLRGEPKEDRPTTFDTTLKPFQDTSYSLRFQVLNMEEQDEETNNAIAIFEHQEKNGQRILFLDSFYCMYPYIDRLDFNNDHINDILLFFYTGGRANPTFHLYLVDTGRNKLNYVKGFEDLPNPSLDTSNGIILSIALSGIDHYSFYLINSRNQLIDLGNGYDADPDDTVHFERAMKKILGK